MELKAIIRQQNEKQIEMERQLKLEKEKTKRMKSDMEM